MCLSDEWLVKHTVCSAVQNSEGCTKSKKWRDSPERTWLMVAAFAIANLWSHSFGFIPDGISVGPVWLNLQMSKNVKKQKRRKVRVYCTEGEHVTEPPPGFLRSSTTCPCQDTLTTSWLHCHPEGTSGIYIYFSSQPFSAAWQCISPSGVLSCEKITSPTLCWFIKENCYCPGYILVYGFSICIAPQKESRHLAPIKEYFWFCLFSWCVFR